MLLINYEINLDLIWSANCFLVAGTVNGHVPTFAVTDKKLYVMVVTLSTQDMRNYYGNCSQDSNAKLTGINIYHKKD